MSERKVDYGDVKAFGAGELFVSEGKAVRSHRDLRVYQRAFALGMELFELSKSFPKEETYSLTDQIRRSSRSVAASIAESWKRRRYPAAFVSKLNEAEAEAAETQTWIDFAVACKYFDGRQGERLIVEYEGLLATISSISAHSDSWTKPVRQPKPGK